MSACLSFRCFSCLAIWIGVALSAIVQGVSDRLSGTSRFTPEGVRGALILLFSILPILSITNNYAVNNQREAGVAQEAWGRYVLSLPIAEKAALLVDSEKIAPLYYLQVTENVRPDLDIMVLGDEALYRQELDRRINAGQAVYLARFLPNLPYRMRSLGPLVEVGREPSGAVPTIGTPINASFGDQIELLGVTEEQSNPYRVNLVWKATSPERKNYHVRLRLVDAQGEVWWEDTGAHPVSGYYPTGAWAPGEVVTDFHEVKLEPYLRPGTYDLQVGLFTPFRNDGLKANGKDYLNVAQISIIAPKAQPLARPVRMVYERTALTSLDEPGTVPPESRCNCRIRTCAGSRSDLIRTLADKIYELDRCIECGCCVAACGTARMARGFRRRGRVQPRRALPARPARRADRCGLLRRDRRRQRRLRLHVAPRLPRRLPEEPSARDPDRVHAPQDGDDRERDGERERGWK